jgi:alkanesulfonate monooxygenase SsuD/methylene tetrahydromethanopterin reductase-like flavin-dependent oxidoreductase (luciferase family)
MAKLDFSIFDWFSESEMAGTAGEPAEIYERHIGVAKAAEQVGYQSYFFIEHQNAPFAYISAPSVYLAALARETTALRFGPMVYQLPMYHPMRLAQDAAMVDQLSRGRLEFGIGYGIHAHEFMRWKMEFSERREMGLESMDIVMKAWTQDEVTYEGKYWSFDEALPKPKPYQKPHPPIWVGAHSEASFEYAAENNFNVAQNINVDQVVAQRFAYFSDAWKKYGHPGPMPHRMLARHVHVAETDAQARAEVEEYLRGGFFGTKGMEIIAKTRIGTGGPGGLSGGERTPDIIERGRVFGESMKSYDFWLEEGLAHIGSPDTVIKRIEAQQKLVGYDILCTQHQIGDMPPDVALKSLRMFGEHVIPAFT